ncbi:MAG: hypothetical protein KDA77_18660, partial [Planctomycetaceae bacterium]|nr:hypothetical protein [Planctomycetaceae bacterium]
MGLKLLEVAAQDADTRDLLYIAGQFKSLSDALERAFEIRGRYRALVPEAEEPSLDENPLILMTATLWEDEFMKYLPVPQAARILDAAARMASEEQYSESDLADSLWATALQTLDRDWTLDLGFERLMYQKQEAVQKEKVKTAEVDSENPALKKQLSDFYSGVGRLRKGTPDNEAIIAVALQIFEAISDWPDEYYQRKDVQGMSIAMSQLAGIMREHDLYERAVELLKLYVSKTENQPNAFILFHLGGIYRRAAHFAWKANDRKTNIRYLERSLFYYAQGL